MTTLSLTGKRTSIALLLTTLIISISFGRVPGPQQVRYRSVKAEPIRIHIDPVLFDTVGKPEVDLRPSIASMGIAIRDQGNRGTCSVFAMTFLLEYAYGKHFGFKAPDFSEEYLNDVKNLATGDDWDGGFFTDIDKGYQGYGIVDARLDPYKSTFNPKFLTSSLPTLRKPRRVGHPLYGIIMGKAKSKAGAPGVRSHSQALWGWSASRLRFSRSAALCCAGFQS